MLARLFPVDWLSQPKAHDRFSRNIHVSVAGEGGARSACAGSGETPDEQANASRSAAPDNHAQAAATADKGCGSLAFAFLCARQTAGVNAIVLSVHIKPG